MTSLKILDVTLRDGGYQTQFHFNKKQLYFLLDSVEKAGFEYIEIGYRNGSLHPIQNIGSTGLCSNEYLLQCSKHLDQCKMAVMVHPHNINSQDIINLQLYGVKLVRICVAQGTIDNALPIINQCIDLGLEISINFTRMSRYSQDEMDRSIEQVIKLPVNIIYFADSNGSMLPNQISKIYQRYCQSTNIAFGFHAHDNLGMAQANSIAAINAGARYIDVSFAGLGKGIGNLKTEYFVAYLHAIKNKKYDLNVVRHAANIIHRLKNEKKIDIEEQDFIMGIDDLTIDDLKRKVV